MPIRFIPLTAFSHSADGRPCALGSILFSEEAAQQDFDVRIRVACAYAEIVCRADPYTSLCPPCFLSETVSTGTQFAYAISYALRYDDWMDIVAHLCACVAIDSDSALTRVFLYYVWANFVAHCILAGERRVLRDMVEGGATADMFASFDGDHRRPAWDVMYCVHALQCAFPDTYPIESLHVSQLSRFMWDALGGASWSEGADIEKLHAPILGFHYEPNVPLFELAAHLLGDTASVVSALPHRFFHDADSYTAMRNLLRAFQHRLALHWYGGGLASLAEAGNMVGSFFASLPSLLCRFRVEEQARFWFRSLALPVGGDDEDIEEVVRSWVCAGWARKGFRVTEDPADVFFYALWCLAPLVVYRQIWEWLVVASPTPRPFQFRWTTTERTALLQDTGCRYRALKTVIEQQHGGLAVAAGSEHAWMITLDVLQRRKRLSEQEVAALLFVFEPGMPCLEMRRKTAK